MAMPLEGFAHVVRPNRAKIEFDEYVDARFAEGAVGRTAWKYEPGSGKAE